MKERKFNLKAYRIANIVFTVLTVACFILCVILCATTFSDYAEMKNNPDDNDISANLGFGFGIVFCVLMSIITMVVSFVGFAISLGKIKIRGVEGIVHVVINLVSLLTAVAILLTAALID